MPLLTKGGGGGGQEVGAERVQWGKRGGVGGAGGGGMPGGAPVPGVGDLGDCPVAVAPADT